MLEHLQFRDLSEHRCNHSGIYDVDITDTIPLSGSGAVELASSIALTQETQGMIQFQV